MSGTKKVSIFGSLRSLTVGNSTKLSRLSNEDNFVVLLMGSLMVIDGKVIFPTEKEARRAFSSNISKVYNSNENYKKKYKTVGDFRKDLESKDMIKIYKESEVTVSADKL